MIATSEWYVVTQLVIATGEWHVVMIVALTEHVALYFSGISVLFVVDADKLFCLLLSRTRTTLMAALSVMLMLQQSAGWPAS